VFTGFFIARLSHKVQSKAVRTVKKRGLFHGLFLRPWSFSKKDREMLEVMAWC
jgi:hypothetical protein